MIFIYIAGMRKVFIADAHLRLPGDDNYRTMLRFLAELPGTADTLYILGDLFEFWIGYPEVPFPQYRPLLDALRALRSAGMEIVYFEGNHDFHMGPYFTETLGAKVYRGPAVLEIDGKRVCLCHGDEINRRDYAYRILRSILHSRLTSALTHVVPPRCATAIADRLGENSRAHHGARRTRWNYPAILRSFAADRFAAGCDMVITGHFHLPLIETSGAGGANTLVSLGDWISHFSYAEMRDGAVTLRRYSPEA
jgi:UDP-2,3-diacylglucosamine hydrolase